MSNFKAALLEDLSLDRKTLNALSIAGIHSVEDLLEYPTSELFELDNMGRCSVYKCFKFLEFVKSLE